MGFRADAELVAIDIRPARDAPAAAEDMLEPVEELFDQLGIAFLTAVRPRRLVVLAAASSTAMAEVLGRNATGWDVRSVGVGTSANALADIVKSFHAAELAAEYMPPHATEPGPTVRRFDDLGTARMILAAVDFDLIASHAERLRDDLNDQPASIETLRAFFEHRMSITATAETMHLHPNSLRYRLTRIERMIGGSLRDPAMLAALYLALRALPGEGAPGSAGA
jgi:purine catabolism regulator